MRHAVIATMLCGMLGCEARPTAFSQAPPADPVATPNTEATADVGLKILDFDSIQKLVASHRGKVVVMDAWSTSCKPCLEEFHNLVELHNAHGADRVACISLSFDYEGIGKPEEEQERVLKFLRGQGATFDNVLSSDESDVLYRKFKLASVPAVFVYDKDGQLAKRFDNEKARSKAEKFTYEQVKQLVADLVSK